MKVALRTGTFIKHSDSLLEFVLSENTDFQIEDAKEINNTVMKHTSRPYAIVVDMRAGITSFDFNAASLAGNHPNERTLALVVNENTPKMFIESLLNIQQITFPTKSVKVFTDKDLAFEWIKNP